jgi:1,4-alpha-glucan branching enzyme
VLLLGRSPAADGPAPVTVRFVLVAPDAHQVTVAGTFNQWDAAATPLVRSGTAGVWTATLSLPAGEHQYAFVVDGARWVPDPSAPAVNDGFGRRNSVLAL